MKSWQIDMKFSNGIVVSTWVQANSRIEAAQKFLRRKRTVEDILAYGLDHLEVWEVRTYE